MLDEAGRMDFTGEILDLVERLWYAYEEAEGQPNTRAERLAGLAYILTLVRRDLEAVWSQIEAAPELRGARLTEALPAEETPPDPERAVLLRSELQRRGWLG